jgi:EAL domain-containing protein (putative c-di-GMP-specific phosphodiesterase class I)
LASGIHWRKADSEGELRTLAREFEPSLVFGTDEPNRAGAELSLLRLFSRQRPEIMVCDARDNSPALWGSEAPARKLLPFPPVRAVDCEMRGLPSLFTKSADLALLVDADGWITHANPGACRLLSAACPHPLGTHLVPADGQMRRQVVAFDADKRTATRAHMEDLLSCMLVLATDERRTVPLVGLNANDSQILIRLHGTQLANQLLSTISTNVQPRYARCGMFSPVSGGQFLLVLPYLSHAADAAVAVQPVPVVHRKAQVDVPIHLSESKPPAVSEAAPARKVSPSPEQIEASLTDAIQRQAIGVHFQPQYEMRQGHGSGMEALARWTLTTGETIMPGVFIPLAERLGMLGELGASVLQNTCKTAAGWRGKETEKLTVSVNVATPQIGSEYSKLLSGALERSGLPASRLELEVEESALLSEKIWVFDWLKTWHQWGVRIAVNHAGLNYAGLKYMSRLHIDRLKLDQSLVRDMTSQTRVAATVNAVIALGAQMNVDVLAEGVETEPQLNMLRDFGCRHVQGFLLARPMPAIQAQLALRKSWGNLPRTYSRGAIEARAN